MADLEKMFLSGDHSGPKVSPSDVWNAARYVLGAARDADDARQILQLLGIDRDMLLISREGSR